jgi:hypothetical protein
MSVDRYSNRRHYLTNLVAGLRASLASPKPRARAATKARPSISASNMAATARKRRLRLAAAEAAMTPAPRRRAPSPPISPEACTTLTVGGSLFDHAPVIYSADGGAAPTSGAARRMNLQATRQQRLRRLARAEADMRP